MINSITTKNGEILPNDDFFTSNNKNILNILRGIILGSISLYVVGKIRNYEDYLEAIIYN